MKLISKVGNSNFKVIAGTKRSQAAEMTLTPGSSTGGPGNLHRESDQWLFVLSGNGKAIVNKDKFKLAKGDLLLIEAGEPHEIVNISDKDFVTVNIYTPPEY